MAEAAKVMRLQSVKAPNLPRVPAVVLHRVNIKGLSLPGLAVSGDVPSVVKPSNHCNHSAAVGQSRASGRVRKISKKALFNSAETQNLVRSKPTAQAHDKVKLAINGCQVVQNSEIFASGSSRTVASTATQQGDRNTLVQDKRYPLSSRVQEDKIMCKSTGVKDAIQHTQICSPPLTRGSSATKRELKGKVGGPRGKISVCSEHKVRARASEARRKRVVSTAFLDSSDGVSDVDTPKEGVGSRNRKRRGTRTTSEIPPTRKRRLSSSGDELIEKEQPKKRHKSDARQDACRVIPTESEPGQLGEETTTQLRMPQKTLPESATGSSRIESKVTGDDRWTCSSDDDFAVSMRLEELQEEKRRLSALTGRIERKEQAAGVCSSPKEVLHPPCVVVNVGEGMDEVSNEEGTTALLRDAGPCCHYDNLEIDPSAIVANCECVVNMPSMCAENESARVSVTAETKGTVDSSVLAPSEGDKMRAETSTVLEKPRSSRSRGRPRSLEGVASKPRSCKPREEGTDESKRPRKPRKGSVSSAKPQADEGATSQQTKRGRGRPRLTLTSPPPADKAGQTKRGRGRPRLTPTSPPPADKAGQTKRGRGRPRLRDSRTPTSPKGRKQEDTTTPKKGRARKKESKNPRNKPGSVLIQGDKVSPQPQLSSPQNGEDSGYPGSISSSSSQGLKTLKSPLDVSPTYILLEDGTVNQGGMLCSLTQHDADMIITQSGTQPQQQRGSVDVDNLGLLSPELTDTAAISSFPLPPSQWEWPAVGMGGANTDDLFQVNCGLDQESEVNQSLFDPSKMIIAKVESLNEDSQFSEYLNEILESEEVMECLNSLNTATSSLTTPQELQATADELTAGLQAQVETATRGALDTSSSQQAEVCVHPPLPSSAAATTSQAPSSGGGFDQSHAESVAAYVAAETNLMPFTVTDCFKTNVDTASDICQASPAPSLGRCVEPVGISPEVKPDKNVMWSQAGFKKTSVQAPKPEQQHREKVCDSVNYKVRQSPPPPLAESPAPTPTPEPRREKRKIYRFKRKPKDRKAVDSSTTGADKSNSSAGKKDKVLISCTDTEAQPPEVKSRKGRVIKPSWKVAQANSKPSLKLPDIPTTCNPNPPISLPSTSSVFSMSLDDVLRQMNDKPEEEKSLDLKFAESLLADVPPATTTPSQPDKREELTHMTANNKESEDSVAADSTETTAPDLQGFVSTPLPQMLQCNVPAKEEGQSGNLGDFCVTASPEEDGSWGAETQVKDTNTSVVRLEDEDDCCATGMDLCDTDSGEDEEALSVQSRHVQPSTPPPLPEFHSAMDSEDEGEDRIDLFVEDIDTFTVYTMDEGKKYNTPPQMPTPPRVASPVPKRHQVVEWVEQQCHVRPYTPPDLHKKYPQPPLLPLCLPPPPIVEAPFPLDPPLPPPTHNPYPLSAPPSFPPSSHPQFVLPHQSEGPPPPPPPPPRQEPNNSGGTYHWMGSDRSCPPQPHHPLHGSRSSNARLCWAFLRGRCNYKNCKFSHIPLSSVSDTQFENVLQYLPMEMITQDITKRYVVKASIPLNNWRPSLIQLVKGLVNMSWDAALGAYSKLVADGVVLSPSLLSRFLNLCRQQTTPLQNPFIQLHKVAREVMQMIRDTQGLCSFDNYHAMLDILVTTKQPVELLDTYRQMKEEGHCPKLDIILLVLRGVSPDDNRILQLLDDSKHCHSTSIDIARVANSLLEKVSPQVLSRHCEEVSVWVSGVNGVLDKLGKDALLKLFNLFMTAQNWPSLLVVLEQSHKAIVWLESRLCRPLSYIISQHPTLSDRASVIMEMMSDESLVGVSIEGWNTVLTQCMLPSTSQRTTKFCKVLSRCNKCLNQEALDALLGMVMTTGCQPSAGVAVLETHLQFIPPVVPSMAVLNNFCKMLDTNVYCKDLYRIVDQLLLCRVAPSLSILQSFVNACNKEKAYSKLAAVVKKAKDCRLQLEKTFYQRALVLLRQWGQDQVAISTIYKSLRTIDTEFPSSSVLMSHYSGALPLHRDQYGDSGRSTPGSVVSRTSSRPCSYKSNKSRKSVKSLEEMHTFERTSEASARSGILALLEGNGRQGQYGAMVSILCNLRDSKSTYSTEVVMAVWRAITESEQKPANSFSNFLEQLKLAQSQVKEGDLCPCDHWLAAQLGIALLKMYANIEQWQSGFVILHHLHRYKIHYTVNCKPLAPLPPLTPLPPSPYGVAKTAVTTCLKVGNVEVAIDVMKECEWMNSCSAADQEERTQLLIAVAEKCLEASKYKNCCKCLQELSAKGRLFAPVAKLYNRLLEAVLSANNVDVDLSMCIYRNMNNANFPCVPHNFSLLLEKLCDLLQLSTARELCKQAIDNKFYLPLTRGNIFSITLPPSIHHIEMSSLIEEHLHGMSQELEGKPVLPLTINFDKGMKSSLEQVLTKHLDPPLTSSFSSSIGTSCVISSANLLQWFNAHYPTSSFSCEKESVPSQGLSSASAGSSASSSTSFSTGRDVKAVVESVSKSTPLSDLSTPEIYTSDSDCSVQHAIPSLQNAGSLKKEFRVSVCRTIVTELKPFYQSEKFKSYEDYLHLVKELTTRVCKSSKSKPSISWTVTDSILSEVRHLVNEVMSNCTTYTPE